MGSGIYVCGSAAQVTHSSLHWREVAAPNLATADPLIHARFCHQLDFSTSGALCVALNKAAAGSAYKCFKERQVTKAYLALVRGHVQESRMTISYAIGRNNTEGRAHTMCIEGTHGCENPKPSLTELVVLEHGLYAGDPVSKVLLQPLTGMFRSRGQEAALAPHCLPTLSCPLCDGCLASAFLFIVHCSICVT
uniref:Pseudouridine synthase RsuA/RluA-like domain-containing protein n=1 Tax=Rousettus aegyptiacus TaxID=9407 RepID=A0A7J8F3N6_ROUAE|nr:hypothetical protein HJG63_016988 [Rousettus aegyptiacus]